MPYRSILAVWAQINTPLYQADLSGDTTCINCDEYLCLTITCNPYPRQSKQLNHRFDCVDVAREPVIIMWRLGLQ